MVRVVLSWWDEEPCHGAAVVWAGNWDYRCEYGHRHKSERGAIGGDFPL
jgi:hypothetical protein